MLNVAALHGDIGAKKRRIPFACFQSSYRRGQYAESGVGDLAGRAVGDISPESSGIIVQSLSNTKLHLNPKLYFNVAVGNWQGGIVSDIR